MMALHENVSLISKCKGGLCLWLSDWPAGLVGEKSPERKHQRLELCRMAGQSVRGG